MSLGHNPSIVTNGIVELLEASVVSGTPTQLIKSKASNSIFTLNSCTIGTTALGGIATIGTNVDVNGTGTSYINCLTTNSSLLTGSITVQMWYNLNGNTISIPGYNSYRALLSTTSGVGSTAYNAVAGSPITFLIETGKNVTITASFTDGLNRRYTNGVFSPITLDNSIWQLLSITYSSSTGIIAAYKNNTLIQSGPMCTGTNVLLNSPTTPGLSLTYSNYIQNGFRLLAGNNFTVNNNGNMICPGEMGNFMVYNRALSFNEINQNFNALRGRYGV